MKKIIPFLFLFIIMLCCCTRTSKTVMILEKADTLLSEDKPDSALIVLKNINDGRLDEEELAYYNLLKTQSTFCLYKPIKSTAYINKSIEFYQKKENKSKLARALYYKGSVLYFDFNKPDEAIDCIKRAESMAKELNDLSLCEKIYYNLALVNCSSGNLNTALAYAKQALEYSYKTGNKNMTCSALDKLSCIFDFKNMPESCLFYTRKVIPYIKYMRKEEQSMLYTNVGISLDKNGHKKEGLFYIKKSLSIKPTPHACFIYGTFLFEQGKDAEAWNLWQKATNTDDLKVKINILEWMADFKKGKGQYKEASEIKDRISMLKDSLKYAQKAENVMQIQKDIEKDESELQAGNRQKSIIAISAGLGLVLVLLIIYYIIRIRKARSIIAECRKLIDKYTRELEEANLSDRANKQEINRLKRKIKNLRERQTAILERGRECFEEIKNGGTVAKWGKADFEAAVEYQRTRHPGMVVGIESKYSKLTPYNTFFLLLEAMEMGDADIRRVMNISPGAMRTMKYRIKRNTL